MPSDITFTAEQILNHRGTVEIFCPAVEPDDSKYRRVTDVKLFVENVFEGEYQQFRPKGRIEGSRMLICMLPQPTE